MTYRIEVFRGNRWQPLSTFHDGYDLAEIQAVATRLSRVRPLRIVTVETLVMDIVTAVKWSSETEQS